MIFIPMLLYQFIRVRISEFVYSVHNT
jgi:hypothetical protein